MAVATPESIGRDAAVSQWRAYLQAQVANAGDAQIDVGVAAALEAMKTERSSERIAEIALAACRNWRPSKINPLPAQSAPKFPPDFDLAKQFEERRLQPKQNRAPENFSPLAKGVVVGLMYSGAQVAVMRGRSGSVMHGALAASFSVRRSGNGPNGRPLPAISVRWQGWKIAGALEDGDEVAFFETPKENFVNSPAKMYNLSKKCDLRMLPITNDPSYKRKKAFWILIILAVVGIMLFAVSRQHHF